MEVQNGELTLNVVSDGEADAPPLLLLHGIISSVRTWDFLVPHLTSRFRVLRLDFRGHGGSDRAPEHYDMHGYVSDAAAVCRAAGAPCVVIGHSLGGATAAGLAQQHPELVRAVVLEDPPIPSRELSLDGNALLDAFRLMREMIPQLQADGVTIEALSGIMAQMPSATGPTMGELLHPDGIESMAAGLLAVDATVLDRIVQGDPPAMVYDASAKIPVPTLLITADPSRPDAVARPEDAAQLQRVTPDAEVLVMDGAGHLIHDELGARQRYLDAVMAFLDRVA